MEVFVTEYRLFKVALDSCGVWVFPYAGGSVLRCDEWRRALSGVWDLCFGGCTGHRGLLSDGWGINCSNLSPLESNCDRLTSTSRSATTGVGG